jgi:hypothetical protein
MAVPYTFGTATASIPLSQLDSNFATAITLGNTAIQLGNTVTTLNNMTLANVTISSGNITLTNYSATTANITTANVVTLIVTGNETVQGNTSVTGTATAAKFIPTGSSVTGNGMYLPATNAVGISTNGTNAVYIDSNQNVTFQKNISVGGATPTTSGTGITFPATQSASSDANTLDDYEEGTWTPTQGSGLTVVGAFSSSGVYTKIGKIVYIRGVVSGATSISAAAGSILTSNLPFAIVGDNIGGAFNSNLSPGTITDISATASSIYTTAVITSSGSIFFGGNYTTTT